MLILYEFRLFLIVVSGKENGKLDPLFAGINEANKVDK